MTRRPVCWALWCAGEQNFFLDVVEVGPGHAISIIETDVNVSCTAHCTPPFPLPIPPLTFSSHSPSPMFRLCCQVDFAPPKDMSADDPRHPSASSSSASSSSAPRRSSTTSSTASSASTAAPEFVFHAGQDSSQEKFFEHKGDGPIHEGDSIRKELNPDPSSPNPAAAGKGDYFAKLGGGHRLNGKKTGAGTPGGGPTVVTAVPAGLSLTSEAAGEGTGVKAEGRATTVVETQGQWDYVYSVDAKGAKKLMRRLPTKKRTVDEGGDNFKAFAGAGHSLKK